MSCFGEAREGSAFPQQVGAAPWVLVGSFNWSAIVPNFERESTDLRRSLEAELRSKSVNEAPNLRRFAIWSSL